MNVIPWRAYRGRRTEFWIHRMDWDGTLYWCLYLNLHGKFNIGSVSVLLKKKGTLVKNLPSKYKTHINCCFSTNETRSTMALDDFRYKIWVLEGTDIILKCTFFKGNYFNIVRLLLFSMTCGGWDAAWSGRRKLYDPPKRQEIFTQRHSILRLRRYDV